MGRQVRRVSGDPREPQGAMELPAPRARGENWGHKVRTARWVLGVRRVNLDWMERKASRISDLCLFKKKQLLNISQGNQEKLVKLGPPDLQGARVPVVSPASPVWTAPPVHGGMRAPGGSEGRADQGTQRSL